MIALLTSEVIENFAAVFLEDTTFHVVHLRFSVLVF